MATTKAIIDVSINTGDASAQLRNLQTQINAFNATLNKTTAAHSLAARQFAKEIITYTNASQAFTAEQVRMETAARRLDQTLTKGRGSLGQYFSAKFNKNGAEAAAVLSLANARAQALETQFVKLTSAAGGFRDAIAIRPLQALNDSMEVANQKAAIHSAMFRQATTSMINFGKNTQWAGRQLMVGFTVPMTIFGAAAGKTFKEIEQAAVRFKKVYGDAFTTPAEIEKNMKAVEGLALEFTKYGIAVKDTIGLAAEAAAAGAQNADLIAATTEATRLATLGQMEQQEALTATIALQNAFKLSAQDLSKEVNFLNMVENQTVVTLQDLAGAIPRVAPVIVGLGGDVRDMAAMLAAMQEGGVSAAQGANALKSGLGSLINPTEKASKVLAEMGVNINSIVQANRGDLMGTVTAFAQALSGLDKFTRQQALEELFGKYQYARLGALFENIIKDGTQASRVLQIAGLSAEQMAKSAEKELSVISEATSTKYMAAMERFKLAIAPVGEMFMKISTPIINFFAKLFEMFDKLPEGAKTFTAFAAIIVGVVVPAGTMFLGLLMNLIGTLAKFGHIIGVAFKGFAKGGIGGAIQSVSQSLRYMGLEEINAAQAAQQLGQSTEFANAALLDQVAAAGNARLAIDRLTQAYDLLIDKQLQVSTRSGTVFGAGAAAGQAAASSGATRVQRRNRGGKIAYMSGGGSTVPGFGNTDTVPAMLTPGEFVVNKKATQENLSLLHAINNGKRVGGFNKGGRIPGVQYLQNAGRVKTLQELIADNYRAEIELGGTTSTQSGNLGFGLPSSTRTLDTLSPAELSLFNSMMRGPLASRGIDDSLIRLFGLGIVPTAKEINDKLRLGTLPGSDASRVFSNPDIWEPMTRTSAGLLLPTSGRSFAESIARQIGFTLSSRETVSDDDIYDEVERAMKANGGAAFYDELQRDPGALRLGLPELLSRHLKSTNPQGSVGSIYEPVLSQVATGVRQVGPYKGRPGVIGNFGSLGWLLLGPGKTLTVSGRSGRSYENEREFDFSRLMPGMVRTHALRPLAANDGGFITPGAYALAKSERAPGALRTSILQPYIDKIMKSEDLNDLEKIIRNSLGAEFLESEYGTRVLGAMLGFDLAHKKDREYNDEGRNLKLWITSELFGATGLENKGFELLFGKNKKTMRELWGRIDVGKDKKFLDAFLSGIHPTSEDEIDAFLRIHTKAKKYIEDENNKDDPLVKKIKRSKTYTNKWLDLLPVVLGMRKEGRFGGMQDIKIMDDKSVKKLKPRILTSGLSKFTLNKTGVKTSTSKSAIKRNKGGLIPGVQYLNAAGMVGKTFLGMPHSFNPKIATRYSALARSDELLKSGRWADMPVSDIGTQVTSIGGFSSTLPGINGVYEIDGKRFVIKAHETPESALAESRSSQLMRDLFGIESPEQELIKFRHPQTGQLVSGVRSPYDERFASSASAISPDSFVRQLIASAIRRDSDLQPDNLWNNVLADSGAAILGVSATGKPSAMTDRAITTSPRAVSEQVDINLLKTKGGAKKWFAEESANIARNMTEDEYVGGILQEIAGLKSRLNSSVDMLPFGTPEEKAMYRTILERDLAELEAYDWRSTYQHHVGLYPEAKKPPTAAAIAKKEKEAQEKARQLGANARMKYGIPWVNKGGLIPGVQYFANAGIVKRLMNSGLDKGQLQRKLVSDNQWDDLDDNLKRQVMEWDASGNTGFGIFGAAARAQQQPSKRAERKSGAYSPLKTLAMTDIDFGDASGLLKLMRGGEFDEADQAFLIDYIKEGLDYGRLKDFHPQARQYHGEYYDTTMSSLVTEAQRIGNPKLIEALVRLTGIQAKNSGGLIPGGMVTPSKNFYGKFNSETVKLFTKWISSQPSQIASMKSGIGEDAGLAKTFAGGFRRSSRAEILERATWLSQMGVPKPGDSMSLGALASFSPKGRGVKQHLSDSQLTKDAESAAYWLSLDQKKQKEDATILRRIMEVGPENWPSWAPERRYFSPITRETGLDAYIRDTRAAIEQRKSSIKESKAKIRSFNQMVPTIIELETPKGTIRANLDDIVALQDQKYMGNQTSEQERILHNALIEVLDVREESDGIRRVVAKLISSQIPGFNTGGFISPTLKSSGGNIVPGTGNTDTVPAMLTPGEFVINKQATMQNLPLLHAINSGSAIRANKGGFIGVQYLQDGGIKLPGMNNMLNLGEVGPTSPLPVNISEVDGQDPARTAMGQDARRQNGMGMGKRFAISSGVGALGGTLSMAPMIPGIGQNEQLAGILGQSGMALGALSMLTMLPPPIAAATAGLAALAAGAIITKKHFDELSKKAADAGSNLGGVANRMEKISQATGYQFARERVSNREFRFSKEEAAFAGQFSEYFESDAGKELIDGLNELTKEERYKEVGSIIAVAIADGMSKDTAKAYGDAIAYYTNDAMLKFRLESNFKQGKFKTGPEAMLEIIQSRVDEASRISIPKPPEAVTSPLARQLGTTGTTNLIGEGALSTLGFLGYGQYKFINEILDAEGNLIERIGQVDWGMVGRASVPVLSIFTDLIPAGQEFAKTAEASAKVFGSSIQILKEVDNAEALIIEQRRKGNITAEQYAAQIAKVREVQDFAAKRMQQAFTLNQDIGLTQQAISSQLVLAGFEGDLANAVATQINAEDIGLKLFGDAFKGIDEATEEQKMVISQVMAQVLSGITPENASQKLAEIESLYKDLSISLIEAAADGMLSAQEVKDILLKNSLTSFAESLPQREIKPGMSPLEKRGILAENYNTNQRIATNLQNLENEGAFQDIGGIQNLVNTLQGFEYAGAAKGIVESKEETEKIVNLMKELDQYKIDIEVLMRTEDGSSAKEVVEKVKKTLKDLENLKLKGISKEIKSALPSFEDFITLSRSANIEWEDIVAKYQKVAEFTKLLDKEGKGEIQTQKIRVETIATIFGEDQDSANNILKAIQEVFPKTLDPMFIPLVLGIQNPEVLKLLSQGGPIAAKLVEAMSKGEGSFTYLKERGTGGSLQTIDLQNTSADVLPRGTSGKTGGGGGTKSISQQLSERLEQVKKLYSGLTNVINAKEMKKFIAGPFAAEFLQYLSEQGEEGINIISKNRKKLLEEYNKYKQIKLTEILNASLIAPLARLEEFRTKRRESRFTGNLISQGLNEEQIDFVREQVGPEAISEYMRLSNKENKTKKDIKDLAVYQKNIDDAIAKSKEFSKISLQESIRSTGLEFKETNKNLDKTLELMASGITPEFANELMQIDRASEMSAEQLKQFGSQILETKTKMEIAKGVLVNLSEEFDLMGQIASTQIEKINKLEIAPIEKEIDGLNKSISNLEKSKKPQQDAINSLREQEQELQKVYEERVKALDEVQKANERIAAQQRGQMDVASALSRGDIAGAAQAALELQRTMAQQRVEDTRNAMQQQNESEREAIAEKIKVHENSIKSIDEQIVSLQDQIALKQGDIEKAKERQLALEEKIYAIQLMRDMIETKRAQQEAALVSGREADAKLLGDQFDLQRSILAGLSYMKTDEGKAQLSQFNQALGQGQALGTPGMSASATTITNAAQLISGTMPLVSDAVTKLIDPKTGIPKNLEDTQSAIATLAKTLGTSAESLQNFVKIAQEFLNTVKLNAIKEIQGATSAAIGQINTAKSEASKSTDTGKTPKTPYFGGFIYRAFGGMIGYRGSREPAPGMMYGGKVRKFGFGSFVPGVGNTDKVPALLTPGEFVVRKSVAQAYRSQLESLNNQVNPQAGSQVYPGVPTKYRSNGIDSLVSIGNLSSFNPFTDLSNVDTSIVDLSRVNANTFPVITNVSSDSYPFDANYSNSQNVLNTFSPVQYTYNVSVNAETGADPDEIARAVVTRINTRDRRNIRGTKING